MKERSVRFTATAQRHVNREKTGGLRTESTAMYSRLRLKKPSKFCPSFLALAHSTRKPDCPARADCTCARSIAIFITRSMNAKSSSVRCGEPGVGEVHGSSRSSRVVRPTYSRPRRPFHTGNSPRGLFPVWAMIERPSDDASNDTAGKREGQQTSPRKWRASPAGN